MKKIVEKKLFQVMIETFKQDGVFKSNDSIYLIAENESRAKAEARKLLDEFMGDMLNQSYVRGMYRFVAVNKFENTFRDDYERVVLILANLFNRTNELNMLYITEQEIMIHCDYLDYEDLDWKNITGIIKQIESRKGHGLSLNIQRT
jgi:uncharacterized protein with GYD domain